MRAAKFSWKRRRILGEKEVVFKEVKGTVHPNMTIQ